MEKTRDSLEELKERFRQVSPGLCDRERNRTKGIIQSLEKDFRSARDVGQIKEYWITVLEKIAIFESARRRDIF